MDRMFDTKQVEPASKTTVAARIRTKYETYKRDTLEDVSFLRKLHEKQRDVLFAKRQAIIESMK